MALNAREGLMSQEIDEQIAALEAELRQSRADRIALHRLALRQAILMEDMDAQVDHIVAIERLTRPDLEEPDAEEACPPPSPPSAT
jgi:hypothetical protein